MIGDSGAALSVDRLVRRYRAARLSIARTGTLDSATAAYLAAPPRSVTAGFALRCIQVHFCFIYMASGLSKLKGNAWWNHNAYWDTLANPEFTGIYYHWYERLLRGVVSYKPLYGAMAAGGVMFTFVAEIGVPFLVWTRLRPYAVMVAAALHAGIAIFMGLVVFSLFMMTLLLCYVPGAAVRALFFSAPAPGERVAVTFGPGPRQRRAAALLAAFDLDGRVSLTPGDGEQLRAEFAGRKATGSAALDLVAEQVALLKFLRLPLRLPALNRLFSGAGPVAVPAPAAVAAKVPVGR